MIRWLVIGIGDIARRRVIPAILDLAPLACPAGQALRTDRVLETVLAAHQTRT
jgi:predicted dehydrogenase